MIHRYQAPHIKLERSPYPKKPFFTRPAMTWHTMIWYDKRIEIMSLLTWGAIWHDTKGPYTVEKVSAFITCC